MYETKHYKDNSVSITFQPIDLCKELGFCLGNAVKYILRAGSKGDPDLSRQQRCVPDFKKAIDYLNFVLQEMDDNGQQELEFSLSPKACVALQLFGIKNSYIGMLLDNLLCDSDFKYPPIDFCYIDIQKTIEALESFIKDAEKIEQEKKIQYV